jgi:hypothetical protein
VNVSPIPETFSGNRFFLVWLAAVAVPHGRFHAPFECHPRTAGNMPSHYIFCWMWPWDSRRCNHNPCSIGVCPQTIRTCLVRSPETWGVQPQTSLCLETAGDMQQRSFWVWHYLCFKDPFHKCQLPNSCCHPVTSLMRDACHLPCSPLGWVCSEVVWCFGGC